MGTVFIRKRYRILLAVTVIVYAFILFSVIIFKTLGSPIDLFTGSHPDFRSLNLMPFHDLWDPAVSDRTNIRSIAGNIILFIPLGLFLTLLLHDIKSKTVILLCVIPAGSFLLELLQYITRVGVTDINDLILNTAGGYAGILLADVLIRFAGHVKAVKVISVFGFFIAVALSALTAILFLSN